MVFKPIPPVFNITLNDEPNLRVLFYWPEHQYGLFETDLLELNARPRKTGQMRLSIECILSLDEVTTEPEFERIVSNWKRDVDDYLNSYFEEFETKTIIIRDPVRSIEKITYNRLRVNVRRLDDFSWRGKVEVCGYKDEVTELVAKLSEDEEL